MNDPSKLDCHDGGDGGKSESNNNSTILEVAASMVQQKADTTYLTFLNNKGKEDSKITWKELWDGSAMIAKDLQDVPKGSRILLCYAPGPEFLFGFWACLRLGLIAVPVYPPDPSSRKKREIGVTKLKQILDACGAEMCLLDKTVNLLRTVSISFGSNNTKWPTNLKYLVTDQLHSSKGKKYGDVDQATAETMFKNIGTISPEDIAFLQFTSGSTSDPKGVMISHGNLYWNMMKVIAPGHFQVLSDAGYSSKAGTCVTWLPQVMSPSCCLL